MTHQTARFIIHRQGLSGFTLRELRELLRDRFNPLPNQVRQAIIELSIQKTACKSVL